MATNIIQLHIPTSHLFLQTPKFKTSTYTLSFSVSIKPNFSIKSSMDEQSSSLFGIQNDHITLTKANIYHAIQGINRGVFGVTSKKRKEIEDLVMQLESHNPTPNPTFSLDKIIDFVEGKAVNVIKFSARGLNLLNGQLTIQASFSVASPLRVNIKYDSSHITPDLLMNLFAKNYDLLLSIFNPEGWLDITYLDDSLRIGRDDKGNIFILERSTDA